MLNKGKIRISVTKVAIESNKDKKNHIEGGFIKRHLQIKTPTCNEEEIRTGDSKVH